MALLGASGGVPDASSGASGGRSRKRPHLTVHGPMNLLTAVSVLRFPPSGMALAMQTVAQEADVADLEHTCDRGSGRWKVFAN